MPEPSREEQLITVAKLRLEQDEKAKKAADAIYKQYKKDKANRDFVILLKTFYKVLRNPEKAFEIEETDYIIGPAWNRSKIEIFQKIDLIDKAIKAGAINQLENTVYRNEFNKIKSDFHFTIGEIFLKETNLSKAEFHFEKATETLMEKRYLDSYRIFVLYYCKNNTRKAFALLDKLAKKFPDKNDYWNLLRADFLIKIKAYKKALIILAKVKDYPYVKSFRLGIAYLGLNNFKNAVKHLRYYRINPNKLYSYPPDLGPLPLFQGVKYSTYQHLSNFVEHNELMNLGLFIIFVANKYYKNAFELLSKTSVTSNSPFYYEFLNLQGIMYYGKGYYRFALESFEEAIKHLGKRTDLLFSRAVVLSTLKDKDKAIKDLEKVCKDLGTVIPAKDEIENLLKDPKFLMELSFKSPFFIKEERNASSDIQANEESKHNPIDRRKQFILFDIMDSFDIPYSKHSKFEEIGIRRYDEGNYDYEEGEYANAILSYGSALEINPNIQEAYFNRALAIFMDGDSKKSLSDFDEFLNINKKDYRAYNNRACMYIEEKEYKKAECDLKAAIEICPDNPLILHNLGLVHFYLEKDDSLEKSLEYFSKVIDVKPDFLAKTYSVRAQVYEKLGKTSEALSDYNTAIAHDSSNEWYQELRDKINKPEEKPKEEIKNETKQEQTHVEDEEDFITRFISVINEDVVQVSISEEAKDLPKLVKENMPKLLETAEYFYKSRNIDRALELYSSLLEIEQDSHLIHNNLGCCFYRKQDFKSAIKHFDRTYEINPSFKDALYNKGLSFASIEEYEKSIFIFTKFLKFNNDDFRAHNLLALSYEYAHYYDKAIESYEKVLSINPDFIESKTHLECVKSKKSENVSSKATKTNENERLVEESDVSYFSQITFSDVGGMQNIKKNLNTKFIASLKDKEIAKNYGKKFGGGLILYGPPGCGKSYVVEALAGELEIPFIKISIADILNMYVGNSEKNLKRIFEIAKKRQPIIIFFDEIEALGGKREGMNQHFERTLVNQFLMEMDKIDKNNENVLVIGATNEPWSVDHALKRSGRFTHKVFVEPPDPEARKEIFNLYTKNSSMLDQLDYTKLAELTEGLSCTNIKSICENAFDFAYEEAVEKKIEKKVDMKDFEKAISKERSDVNEWFEQAKQYATNNLFRETYKELVKYLEKDKAYLDNRGGSMFG
ncbi:MAG: tetratricopeptide repeat protein [Candidatus Micrarchaeota archaeon]